MDKLRFAIVGCGLVARRHHLPALLRNPKVEIGALCDVAVAEAQSLKDRFRLKSECYTDLEEVLADRTVDVVDVCAPSLTHYEYARRSIAAGKHVLVEKPPTYRVEQAEDLISLSERRGVKLGVVLNQRYREVIERVKEAEESGLLGKIAKVHITHHANLVFSESPWMWDERKSKYMLYEFGIHLIDLLVYFCGPHREVVFVLPTSQESVHTVSDLQMIIRFEGGQLGIADLTQDPTRHSAYFTHVNVYGTGMDAFARFFPPQVRLSAGIELPHRLVLAELRTLARFGWSLATGKFMASRNRPHQRVLDMYVAWLTQGTPYPLTMPAALPTLRLLNAIEERIPQYSSEEDVVLNTGERPLT
jgi:predicted dehydrogenase